MIQSRCTLFVICTPVDYQDHVYFVHHLFHRPPCYIWVWFHTSTRCSPITMTRHSNFLQKLSLSAILPNGHMVPSMDKIIMWELTRRCLDEVNINSHKSHFPNLITQLFPKLPFQVKPVDLNKTHQILWSDVVDEALPPRLLYLTIFSSTSASRWCSSKSNTMSSNTSPSMTPSQRGGTSPVFSQKKLTNSSKMQ